jgi:hypothetical protein
MLTRLYLSVYREKWLSLKSTIRIGLRFDIQLHSFLAIVPSFMLPRPRKKTGEWVGFRAFLDSLGIIKLSLYAGILIQIVLPVAMSLRRVTRLSPSIQYYIISLRNVWNSDRHTVISGPVKTLCQLFTSRCW